MSVRQPIRGSGRGFLGSALVAALALAGCSDFKQAIGLEPTMPDEFAVESNPPLVIPPDFDLRPPTPGAPRPQEVSMSKQAEQVIVTAEAESRQRQLAGKGEAQRVMQVGLSEASVLLRKISSFGDPRLYALAVVAEHLAHATQPLVPERVFTAGANGDGKDGGANGMLGLLINLLVAEKSGFQASEDAGMGSLKEFADRMTRQAMESMQQAAVAGPAPAVVLQAEEVPTAKQAP